MFVCCECCVLSGLSDGLITRPGESYRLWRFVVCDQETSKTRRLSSLPGCENTTTMSCNAKKTTNNNKQYLTEQAGRAVLQSTGNRKVGIYEPRFLAVFLYFSKKILGEFFKNKNHYCLAHHSQSSTHNRQSTTLYNLKNSQRR